METHFLAPIEKPKSRLWKLIYFMARKRFCKVITPLKVSAVRMPIAFSFSLNTHTPTHTDSSVYDCSFILLYLFLKTTNSITIIINTASID